MDTKTASYRPLMPSTSFSDEGYMPSKEEYSDPPAPTWRRCTIANPMLGALLSLITLTIIIIGLVLLRTPTDMQCTKQLNLYSPALEAIEYIDGDFVNDFNVSSIYRGPPIPEREAAWDKLTYKHGVEVPADKIAGLNRSELNNLKHVPEDVGTGYVAILEVFHQLHCLNIIRMYTWWQVGKYPGVPAGLSMSPLKNRMHVDHCIESLRISLQCSADVTPLFVKLGGPAGAKADFNSHHRCRNFEKIEAWVDDNWSVL